MKKFLLFAMSALLLITGCAKDIANPIEMDGGLQKVTFTATMDDGAVTKALADNDGNAAFVNRCIMEIYYDGSLFERQYAAVSGNTANFTATLVANRTYDVAFWADYVESTTEAGLQVDKYYNTRSESGLQAVALKGTYAGNNDARDAFALCKTYTVSQQGGTFSAVLKRPFAQINVITTDVATVSKAASLQPDKVKLTLKNAVKTYNVLDSTAVSGSTGNLTYTADVYGWDDTKSECTLSMDYIFAESAKSIIDIEWAAVKSGNSNVEHSFSNIPYQRNYRTNIKGALLTTQGQWTVTVDPVWAGNGTTEGEASDDPYLAPYVTAYNIADGNAKMLAGAHYVNVLEPNDADTVNVKIPNTETIGNDYGVAISGTPSGSTVRVEELGTYSGTLGVTGPNTTNFQINCPNLSVTLNGEQQHDYASVTAATAESTLFVDKGVTISDTLTITKGAAYIYGNVADVTLAPAQGCTASVKKWHVYNLEQFNKAIALPADTVVLEANITPTAAASVTNDVVIDLNGHNITAGSVGMIFNVDKARLDLIGTGIISNASIPVESGYYMIRVTGSAENTSDRPYRINVGEEVTLNANGYAVQVLNASGSENSYGVYVNICSKQNTTGYALVTVSGNIHATEGYYPVVTLNDGVNLTSQGSAVYGAGYAQYQFIGGTYNCKETGAEIRAGIALFLDGCELTATDQPTSVTQNGSGSTSDGAAIAIAQHSTKLPVTVYIYGGSFTGYSALYESNPQNNDEESIAKVKMYVYGGKFKTNNGGQKVIYSEDCEKFITVSSSYTPAIFSIEPDAEYIADTYGVVANTDNATMATYPYTISKGKLIGSGTVADPYQIGSAEDLKLIKSSGYYSNFLLTQDVVTTGEEFTVTSAYATSGIGKSLTSFICGTFDGGGHTIRFPEGATSYAICDGLYGGTIKNLNVEFPEEGTVAAWTDAGARFENVDVSGKLLHFNGNCGAYCIYCWKDITFVNCDCSADITGKGGKGDYNAVFIGYTKSNGLALTFQNCTYSGKMVCGRSAMFVGNPCCRNITMNVENCTNAGTIISTYVDAGYKMNYYAAISNLEGSNNYDSFVLNGTSHLGMSADNSWVPLCWEDNLVTTTGQAINGPEQTGMVFQRGGDNQFIITPATDGKINGTTVHHYVVSTGLYVGIQGQGGSSRQYATETITPDGSASYTTTMKDLQFVDRTYVGSGEIVTEGANNTYTDANGTYYVIGASYSTDGQPESATLYNLSAFDENGVLLATANLTVE